MNTVRSFFDRRAQQIARVCMFFGLAFVVIAGVQNTTGTEIVARAGTAAAVFFAVGFILGFTHTFILTSKAERKVKEGQRWMKLRSQGRMRFIIVNCILLWAYPLAVLVEFIELFPPQITMPFESVGEAVFFFILWTLIGIVFGFWYWHVSERKMGPVATPTSTQSVEAV